MAAAAAAAARATGDGQTHRAHQPDPSTAHRPPKGESIHGRPLVLVLVLVLVLETGVEY